jgi:heme-degrading monooxygenase HmoA
MFARTVTVRLKSNAVADFNRTLENEIVPILRRQKGFQDELTLVAPDGTEAIGISLWDNKQSAEAYQRQEYPEVQKLLSKSIEGTPQVKAYEVPFSTLAKSARGSGGKA